MAIFTADRGRIDSYKIDQLLVTRVEPVLAEKPALES
mgnify:CR=1 FL=1